MITKQIADERIAERLRSGQIQIVPIRILEQLVVATLHLKKSPLAIADEKKERPERGYGDWSWFLRKELKLDMNHLLTLLTPSMEAADEFYEEIDAAIQPDKSRPSAFAIALPPRLFRFKFPRRASLGL